MPKLIVILLAAAVLTGCARATVSTQPGTATTVSLNQKNYRMVKPNVIGASYGFTLLGIIPMWRPNRTNAMSDCYAKLPDAEGRTITPANVLEERSSTYLILFSIPKVTVRTDFIEFIDESDKTQAAPKPGQ